MSKLKRKSKYSYAYCCNDCERGFTNQAAWEHHGAGTGHNINGDLPGKEQRLVSELQARIAKLEEAYRLTDQERARLWAKVNAIQALIGSWQ